MPRTGERHETPEIGVLRLRIERVQGRIDGADPLERLKLARRLRELQDQLDLLTSWSEPQLPNVCAQCGAHIDQPAVGRPRETCGDACRAKRSRARRRRWEREASR